MRCLILCLLSVSATADPADIISRPRVAVVSREGITGAGQVVAAGKRLLLFYPNHPDDFGGTGGCGASVSEDAGGSWTALPDDWPLGKTVDLWADALRSGELLAFGIHWVPDPKKRGELTAKDVPADAYQIAISSDEGRSWKAETAVIDCPPQFGIIARPLPHIIEDSSGTFFMPAYAWGKAGNHALLLTSKDRGRHWGVLSSITSAAAMVKAGAPVTTPWLETTVATAQNGDLLAIVRTGSSVKASLVSVRSTDRGKTWATPEKLPFAGKLPTLKLLPSGTLALLTAHSKNHCRLYLSADGNGSKWSSGHVLTSQSGGNAGMTISGTNEIVIISPANRRIDAWRVSVGVPAAFSPAFAPLAKIDLVKGILSWSGSAASHRVTPVLIQTAAGYEDAEVMPHASIITDDSKLDLSRQLLPGATYMFEISAVDHEGRVSAPLHSAKFMNR